MSRFSGFPDAFGQLRLQSRPGLNAALGTDGLHLFYDPHLVEADFIRKPEILRESFLHLHLHCLAGHLLQSPGSEPHLWDAACDLAVSALMEKLEGRDGAISRRITELASAAPIHSAGTDMRSVSTSHSAETDMRSVSTSHFAGTELLFNPRLLSEKLQTCLELLSLASDLARDTHECWPRDLSRPEADRARVSAWDGVSVVDAQVRLTLLEQIQSQWQDPADKLKKELAEGSLRRGHSSGKDTRSISPKRQDSIDYRRFLRRFTISREELELDMDSFDYIPYCFGLETYGNMPFIEPLEYREVNRLDELAIAIDTSGSCSGRIVQRFLEETWSILRQRENFFSRMRLHVIQCDCAVLEHRIFTSVREWEEALPQFRVQGFGDTDFRPVFELLDDLIARGEIRQLRGLLYFTDGDGIFPRSAPSYETAFVFLNQELEKRPIPDWAIRLNLELPEDLL